MKLKRFLALVVSLVMVISMIPAFSLTASAATTRVAPITDIADTIDGSVVVWSAPQGNVYYDVAVGTAFEGWAVAETNGATINVREYDNGATGTSLQIYGGTSNGNYTKVTAPGYAKGATTLIFEWIENWPGESMNHVFYDADGETITNAWIDSKYGVLEENGFGAPETGSKLAVVCTNTDSGHTAEFYVNGTKTYTRTYDYQVSGFGGLGFNRWTTGTWHMRNLTISAVYPSTMTVNYVDENGTNIGSKSVGYASGVEKTFTEDEVPRAISYNGALYARDNDNTLTITPNGSAVNITYTKAKTITDASETVTATWMAAEFTLTGSSGYRDYYVKDTAGNQITGFCWAGPTDGFYPQDRQSLSANFTVKNYINDVSTTWTSDSTKIRIEVQKYSDSEYNVQYVAINGSTEDIIASYNYTGSPVGLTIASDDWKSGSGGNGDNFVFTDSVLYAVVPETVFPVTATYTVNGETVNTVTKTYNTANGESGVDFDAYYYSANGSNIMYKADAITNTSDNVTVALTETVANPDNVYSEGGSITVGEQTGTIASGNLIPNAGFDYGVAGWYAADGSEAASSNFTTDSSAGTVYVVNNGGSSSANTLQRSWAIESGKTYVFTYNQTQTSTDKKWQRFCLGNDFANNNDAMLSGAGAGDAETGQSVVEGTNTVIFTNSDGYKYANFRAAYSQGVTFSDFGLYEVTGLTNDYTVTSVDTNGIILEESKTVTALSVEALDIPYFKGYIFKERTVDGLNVTYTYEATETSLGSWAIRNNVVNEAFITEMKYLGTHNSFANIDDVSENQGGVLNGIEWADASYAASYSKTQTLDALDQLNAGVRYFDIRLTREEDGQFWTFHGPKFGKFRPVAVTIAQWAKENPGEVIILDFHNAVDALYTTPILEDGEDSEKRPYNGGSVGDDNRDFYNALVDMLKETGLWDYIAEENAWDVRYSDLTDNGTKTGIVAVSKNRGANCVSKFISRDSHTSGDTTYAEPSGVLFKESTYDDSVAKIEKAIADGQFGSGAKFGIIHAYSTPFGNLVDEADTNRSKYINEDLDSWMATGYGDILLMNNVTEADITTYLARLSEYNRDYMNDKYGSEIIDYTTDDNEWAGDNIDGVTVNGVKLDGANTILPYSTEFRVTKTTPKTASYEFDGVTYTSISDYTLEFLQFDKTGVAAADGSTFTFTTPGDTLKTYAIIYDNTVLGKSANPGENVSVTSSCNSGITVTLVETDAPGADMTINYQDNGTTVLTIEKFVVYGYEAYNVPAGKFWIANDDNTDAAILESASAQSYIVTEAVDGTANTVNVPVTLIERHAALEDAFVTGNGNSIYGANSADASNKVFIGAGGGDFTGVDYDADGVRLVNNTPSGLTWSRTGLIQFPVVDLGTDEAAIAVFPVDSWHGNSFSNGNPNIRLSAYAFNTSEWTDYANDTAYNPADSSKFLVANPVFSNVATSSTTELQFDVTEFMQAAKNAGMTTLTIRVAISWGGCYLVQTEDAVAGGSQAGRAAYIDVVDAYTVSVTGATKVTKMGADVVTDATSIVVPVGNTIKVRETESALVAFTDGTKVYATDADGYVTIEPTATNAEYYAASLGLTSVNGAQVRIGYGVDRDGKVGSESGLRFITTVNYTDSLANVTGAEMGVEITAEGSSAAAVKIVAEQFQNADNTVFTTALTNLAESNFNRKFTATPYVTVDGQTFYGSPVTRSIYQVAAGLLVNTSTDGTDYDQSALDSTVLYKVLNAYVNQTGIRLQITKDDEGNGTGLEIYNVDGSTSNYSGDEFFEVVSTSVENEVYTITIKPAGDKTTINSYWQEYIRINNNNSKIAAYTSMVDNGDGTVTITFDYASYLAAPAQ